VAPVPCGARVPALVLQVHRWRSVRPWWLWVSTDAQWAQRQYRWGREDCMQHLREFDGLLRRKRRARAEG
jgi:hypothetical protein